MDLYFSSMPMKELNLCIFTSEKQGGFAKYWMEPIELDFSQGMKVNELKTAEDLVLENVELIKRKWYEVHGS